MSEDVLIKKNTLEDMKKYDLEADRLCKLFGGIQDKYPFYRVESLSILIRQVESLISRRESIPLNKAIALFEISKTYQRLQNGEFDLLEISDVSIYKMYVQERLNDLITTFSEEVIGSTMNIVGEEVKHYRKV